jgi:hypothetical protein
VSDESLAGVKFDQEHDYVCCDQEVGSNWNRPDGRIVIANRKNHSRYPFEFNTEHARRNAPI